MQNVSDSVLLHSRHDPVKEAFRFADAHKFTFNPSFIIISEPGKSYLASIFRNYYPQAKLIAFRYHPTLFSEFDSLWDMVWRPGSNIEPSDFLFKLIPDEYLPLTVFLAWNPSDKLWPDISSIVWNGISSVIKLQTSVMFTRTYFGNRWFANMVKNTLLITDVINPKKTHKPYLLAASGPSLEKQFPIVENTFYICAVSSALSCLRYNNCTPDVCISTDGGYWALLHFRNIELSIPVAFPLESAVTSNVLEGSPLIILTYGSELEKKLLSFLGIEGTKIFRNGSVSGTAALYSLAHTSSSVYAAGLDLCSFNSFSHSRPHVSDISLVVETDRFHPVSTLLYLRNTETRALDMYASWFSSQNDDFRKRFFRLYPENRKIPGIKSINKSGIKTLSDQNENQNFNIDANSVIKPLINNRKARKDNLVCWLRSVCNDFSLYTDLNFCSTNIERFISSIWENNLYNEIIQMVSYIDYVSLLKKMKGKEDFYSLIDSVWKLSRKTVEVLEKLLLMVQKLEL